MDSVIYFSNNRDQNQSDLSNLTLSMRRVTDSEHAQSDGKSVNRRLPVLELARGESHRYGTPSLSYVNLFNYMRCNLHYMRCILRYMRCLLHYMRCLSYYMHCFSYYTRCFCHYMRYFCNDMQCFRRYMRCFRHYTRYFCNHMQCLYAVLSSLCVVVLLLCKVTFTLYAVLCLPSLTRCFCRYIRRILHYEVMIPRSLGKSF